MFQNVAVQDDEIPQTITNTLSSISGFSVLFWLALGTAVLALGLIICWYIGARIQDSQNRRQKLAVKDLPMTIVAIILPQAQNISTCSTSDVTPD